LQTDITATFSENKLIKALCDIAAYSHDVDQIKLIETHISWVLLTGKFAYKIKKPVNFGFLDFSTLEKRKFCCWEEVRLNQRLVKDWYVEVVPITGSFDCPKIGGNGEPIEYAVKMVQFPSTETLSQSAENGKLTRADIDQISRIVADFHQSIDKAATDQPYGESRDIKRWFDENFAHIRLLLNDEQAIERLNVIDSWSKAEWVAKSPLMQQRKQSGFIRECHGDLHLGNMTQIDGKIILFDCIEFNPMLRWIDVISEIAFVIMDLMLLGYEDFAYRFLNQYLQQTGDYEGLGLLRYYVVYRALVRAKVALLRKSQNADKSDNENLFLQYQSLIVLADKFSKVRPLRLIITHGFSGSGKSTYACQLAEKTGVIQIRSDIERKRLFGYQAQLTTQSATGNGIYTNKASVETYQRLADLAKTTLDAGFSVIIDAAFLNVNQREQFKNLAKECLAVFTIIDCQASSAVLRKRIELRHDDPSEATLAVLERQLDSVEPLHDDELKVTVKIDTETGIDLDSLVAHIEAIN
jgi:uncharacterized protein